jgi:hypothetical protein
VILQVVGVAAVHDDPVALDAGEGEHRLRDPMLAEVAALGRVGEVVRVVQLVRHPRQQRAVHTARVGHHHRSHLSQHLAKTGKLLIGLLFH